MNGRRLGWLCVLALVAGSPVALAQDSAVTVPKPAVVVPKAVKPLPVPAQKTAQKTVQKTADPQIDAANELASIAAREATCLREAAQHVTLAAQRLSNAPAEMIDKRRDELQFQLGVMEECRNIARQRESEASAGPFAQPPPAQSPPAQEPARPRRGQFSFGEILIESGAADAAVMVPPLRQNAARFTRCYERAGKAKSRVKLRLRMVPSAGGARPSTIEIPGAPRRDGGFHRCLANALMETPFPKSLIGSDVTFMMGFADH